MSNRSALRLALGAWLLALVLALSALALLMANRSTWPAFGPDSLNNMFSVYALALTYPSMGFLILRSQPHNRVGWIVLTAGLLTAAAIFGSEYSVRALVVARASLPAGTAVAAVQNVLFFPAVFPYGLGLLLLLFPTGEPPSRRWWWLFWVITVDAAWVFIAGLLAGGELTSSFRDIDLHMQNPLGVLPAWLYGSLLGTVSWALLLFWLLLAGISSVIRMRSATGPERQQVKWVVFVAVIMVAGFIIGTLPIPFLPSTKSGNLLFSVGVIGATIGIPVAMAIAITRYRLYDIDLVISRTLLFALMAVFIGAVYVGIVVGVGYLLGGGARQNLLLSIVATAVVALAFQPVREWVERLANRLVYGRRLTPYEALSRFSDQVAVYGSPDMLAQIARAVADGVGASAAAVWVKQEEQLVPGAVWPADAPTPAGESQERLVEVTHLGETLGAISVAKPRGERLTPVEEGLLEDLAAQAGPVLHNVALNHELLNRLAEVSEQEAELRRSRQRIVAAQDAERRRLERNIHDGAQQHLVALAVKLRLARTFAARDPARASTLLEELEEEAGAAQETLGALSRGIYPPLLTASGLEVALKQEAKTLGLACRVICRDARRYDLDIEGAVYFCCLEALQNAAKHARGSEVEVTLEESGGELQFSVRDRGPGFDEAKVRAGSGLKNMRDRIEALGGYVQVFSRPGQGAWVVGRVPVQSAAVIA